MNYNDTLQLLHSKREIFHVSIRKAKREEMFNQKRYQMLNSQIKNNALADQILTLAEIPNKSSDSYYDITQVLKVLEPYLVKANLQDTSDPQVQLLLKCLQYFTTLQNLCLDGALIGMFFNLLEICLYHRKSFLRYIESEEQQRQNIIYYIVSCLLATTYNYQGPCPYFTSREEILLDLINKVESDTVFEKAVVLLANLVSDESTLTIELLKRDVLQKVVSKFFELGLMRNERQLDNLLYLFQHLTYRYDSFGSHEINLVLGVVFAAICETESPSLSHIARGLQILVNLTQELNNDGQRTQTLINKFIDFGVLGKVVGLLIDPEAEQYEEIGWQFFINLSFVTDNGVIRVLVENRILLAIQCKLNQDPKLDIYLYMVLSNLFLSNIFIKDLIKESGIISRIVSGFQIEISKPDSKLLIEISHCVANAIHMSTIQQLDYYNEIDLLICPIIYLTEIPMEAQDNLLVKDLLEVITTTARYQNDFMLKCRQNQTLISILHRYCNNFDDGHEIVKYAEQILTLII